MLFVCFFGIKVKNIIKNLVKLMWETDKRGIYENRNKI